MMSQLAVVGSPVQVLCYERISDDKSGRAAGATRQHDENEKVAHQHGATEIRHYRDNDKSASKARVARPEFERLIRDIETGQYDGAIVVAWAQDRITRGKGNEHEALIALFELHNIRFIAPADGIDMVPADGALISRIRNAVAVEEIRKLKARHSLAMAQQRAAGKRTGRTPFGWNDDGTAHAEHAPMIVEAVERVLSGQSIRSIASDFNKRGLPQLTSTRRTVGGVKLPPEEHTQIVTPWNCRNLGEVIGRPSNAGWYMHHGVRLDVTPEWDALISEDRWLALKSLLDGRRRPSPQRAHFLGGIMTCGVAGCDGTVYGATNRIRRGEKTYEYRMYRCGKCQQRIRPIEEVDEFINEVIVGALIKLRLPDLASTKHKVAMSAASDRADALRARLTETNDDYAEMAITKAERDQITAKIKPALSAAEAEISRLSDGRKHALSGRTGPRAAQAWKACTDDQKRSVISLLASITLLPGVTGDPIENRLMITWNKLS